MLFYDFIFWMSAERVRELEEEVERGRKRVEALEKELCELKEEGNIAKIRKEKEGFFSLSFLSKIGV